MTAHKGGWSARVLTKHGIKAFIRDTSYARARAWAEAVANLKVGDKITIWESCKLGRNHNKEEAGSSAS